MTLDEMLATWEGQWATFDRASLMDPKIALSYLILQELKGLREDMAQRERNAQAQKSSTMRHNYNPK